MIVDDLAQGDSAIMGRAYAVNVIGCILGPLFVGYILLPLVGARVSLIFLVLPIVAFAIAAF